MTGHNAIQWCGRIATYTEEPGRITRTFLSAPMHGVHRLLREWMERLAMEVSVDAAGNLRGLYAAKDSKAPRLLIGSHLDTVPDAGAFDGVLGVVLGIALVEALNRRRLGFGIEVLGFSEEEGVRFGIPFIGSRALIGAEKADDSRIADALRAFGLDPSRIGDAELTGDVLGYLEFHIEQGPVLDNLNLGIGIVESIVGQSRIEVTFTGKANHAGTTPMSQRQDALACAAEWISLVEREAYKTPGLVATVGKVSVAPGAVNVIPGAVRTSLDIRHLADEVRKGAAQRLLDGAEEIAKRRKIAVKWQRLLDEPATQMDPALTSLLARATEAAGHTVHRMTSGAGHDAMILAQRVPTAMLFLRSPLGISHHPDETIRAEDVSAALETGLQMLALLEEKQVRS